MPARYIARPKLTDGTLGEWPLCEAHMPFAMVAGWFPIDKIEDGQTNAPHYYNDGGN